MTGHGALRPMSPARMALPFAAVSVVAMALTGCGAVGVPGSASPDSPVASSPDTSPSPHAPSAVPSADGAWGIAAPGEVLAQGTVLQQEEGPPQLCLGGVLESYPPQCAGPVTVNKWDWNEVEQSETAAGVTWGSYAVQGTWDGTTFTRTGEPIPLSLYDPLADIDPRMDPANPGTGGQTELEQLEVQLLEANQRILTSSVVNGYLFVTVVYDDGTLQERYDQEFGPDTVIVQSALRPVS